MKDFYKIDNIQVEEGVCKVTVKLDPDHAIYQAHFPGHPITPGAVLFGIAVRLVGAQWSDAKDITEVKNLKFIQPHYPQEHLNLTFSFETGKETVSVIVSDEDIVFTKMILVFG